MQYDFSFGARLGLSFGVEASFLSVIAVISFLVYIVYKAIMSEEPRSLLKLSTGSHMRLYLVNLLISDLIQALGGMIHIRWIADAGITEGSLCTAQAVLKEIGEVSVAMATLAIAIHTFSVIVLRWQPKSLGIPIVAISLIWVFIALMIGISAAAYKGQNYWGDTGYWCWITQGYQTQRIVFGYLWLWLACLMNIILYVPVALSLRGNLEVHGFKFRLMKKDRSEAGKTQRTRRDVDVIAVRMLYYPFVYIATVIPLAATRWSAFQGHSVSLAAIMAAEVLFDSSGLFNALLFAFTRPTLLSGYKRFKPIELPIVHHMRPPNSIERRDLKGDVGRC